MKTSTVLIKKNLYFLLFISMPLGLFAQIPFETEIQPADTVVVCAGEPAELCAETAGGVPEYPLAYGVTEDLNFYYRVPVNDFSSFTSTGTPYTFSDEFYGAEIIGDSLFVFNSSDSTLVYFDTAYNTTTNSEVVGTSIPSLGADYFSGLAYDVTSDILYGTTVDSIGDSTVVYQVSRQTGALIPVSSFPGLQIGFIVINRAGEAFGYDISTGNLYFLDLSAGTGTLELSTGRTSGMCTGADFDPLANIIYGFRALDTAVDLTEVYEINLDSNTTTVIDTVGGRICNLALANDYCDAYTYSWSPSTGLNRTDSCCVLADPASSTTYTVTVTDRDGNTTTDQVTVEPGGGAIACNFYVQVSVDEMCEALITPDMVLAGTYSCQEDFEVEIPGRPEPIVNIDDLGDTVMYQVINPGNGNMCMGFLLVEDKMAPTVSAADDTIPCFEALGYPAPEYIDNCGGSGAVFLIDSTFQDFNCDTFTGIYMRVFIAMDPSGNVSEPDTQNLYLTRVEIDSVEFPEDRTVAGMNALSCSGTYPQNAEGYPDPSFTGYPVLYDSVELLPGSYPRCNINVSYMDLVDSLGCVTKITRRWQVMDWSCDTAEEMRIVMQAIEIVDTSSPVITCQPDITLTTTTANCETTTFIPLPSASDSCNTVQRISLRIDNSNPIPYYEADYSPQNVTLPAGVSTLTFTAYDDCNNTATCTRTITVEDNTNPTAVCNDNLVVSINNLGTGRLYAEDVDEGSYDDCGAIDSIAIARMSVGCDGSPPSFGPYIEFSCCDIEDSPVMVILRVYDESGNTNECMVEATVQDKLPASLACPPDVTISCEFPYDPSDLTVFGGVVIISDPNDLNTPSDPREEVIIHDPQLGTLNFGPEGFAYDNCSVTTSLTESVDVNNCEVGTITRTFTAEGPGGPSASCIQTISIINEEPFTENDIQWPLDYIVTATCGTSVELDPDSLSAPYDYPVTSSDFCDLLAINYEDRVFDILPPTEPACFKVVRTWSIINWCEETTGTFTVYEYDQTIKVMNNTAPVITSGCGDSTICTFDTECMDGLYESSIEAVDDCTPEADLQYSYSIDLFNDGTFEIIRGSSSFSNLFPIGEHRVVWQVEDGCGNSETCTELFEIQNCKLPTATCFNGISVNLAAMDLDGDGTPDAAMAPISASILDGGSEHVCGYDITASFSPTDTDSTEIMFSCADTGINNIPLFITDENGGQAVCIAEVRVTDNDSICPSLGSATVAVVSGQVFTEDGDMINQVEVSLGAGMPEVMTENDGNYQFTPMPVGGHYQVVPVKNSGHVNGVTSWDVLLIQKHILGLKPFYSPYKRIAADVNRDRKISATDMVHLKKLILSIWTEFPQNTSWRFVDPEYEFQTATPEAESFPELYPLEPLTENMFELNFIGIKVGDVNGTANPSSLLSVENRSNALASLEAESNFVRKGEKVSLPVFMDNVADVEAIQFSFHLKNLDLEGIKAGIITPDDSGWIVDDNELRMIWHDVDGINGNAMEPLFTLVLTAHQDMELSSSVRLTKTLLPKAYTEGEDYELILQWRNDYKNALFGNVPNPFTDRTIIEFSIEESEAVRLEFTDITGRVMHHHRAIYEAGKNSYELNAALWPAGVYYCKMRTETFTATRIISLVR